jgi:NTE family protein
MLAIRAMSRWLIVAVPMTLAGCFELPSRSAAPGAEPRAVAPAIVPPRLALVLSGGSLRGFAHLGVLKVLEAHGLSPDLVVGTSAGSIVGGLYASGLDLDQLAQAAGSVTFDLSAAWTGAAGSPVHDLMAQHAKARRIEQFPMGFAAVAADIQRGCVAVFNGGDVAVAVQASSAMPGVFKPTEIAGRNYADGGLVSPLPVRVARALGAQRVIAVNVTFDPHESKLSGTIDRLFQTMLVLVRTLATQEAREADLLIEPKLPPEAEVTLENRDALIAAGERAALAALPRIRALLATDPIRPARLEDSVSSLNACEPMLGKLEVAGL